MVNVKGACELTVVSVQSALTRRNLEVLGGRRRHVNTKNVLESLSRQMATPYKNLLINCHL